MIGLALLAPPANGSSFPISTTTLVIIAVVVILGGLGIIGWRAPDRSPGADEKAERDRADD